MASWSAVTAASPRCCTRPARGIPRPHWPCWRAARDIDQASAGDGTGPILMATINGHYDLAMLLLERGADPNLASHAGTTPLFAAINTNWAPKSRYPQQHIYMQQDHTYLEVMRKLLDAGADPDARLNRHLWFMSYNFDLLQIDARGATPFWRAAYALDVEAMKLLVAYGADPSIPTSKGPSRRSRGGGDTPDPSGLPPVPVGGPAVHPIHAASGVGYGQGYAGNAHRHVPDGWIPAVRYLVEELGADVNARDHEGYAPLHHAAARGDNELIRYLVSRGADVMVVSRRGQTTVDMANGPVQRIQPFPETIAVAGGAGGGEQPQLRILLTTGGRGPTGSPARTRGYSALSIVAGALAFLGGCGDRAPEAGERGDAAGPTVVPVGDILLEETYQSYLGNPYTLVVDTADGSFLVSDHFQGRIIRFGRDGGIVQRYGAPGEGPAEFKGMGPTFILNDSVVAGLDVQRRLFKLFAREDGEYLESFRYEGSIRGDVSVVAGMVVAPSVRFTDDFTTRC